MSNGPRYRGKTFHEYMSAKFWHPASKRNIVTVWKRKQQMEVRLDKWLPDTIIMHLNGAIIVITGSRSFGLPAFAMRGCWPQAYLGTGSSIPTWQFGISFLMGRFCPCIQFKFDIYMLCTYKALVNTIIILADNPF